MKLWDKMAVCCGCSCVFLAAEDLARELIITFLEMKLRGQMELTKEENDVLLDIVASAHLETLRELCRTDAQDYKKKLKWKLNIVEAIYGKLNPGAEKNSIHAA